MRCGCSQCGTFMVNADSECVCPACLSRCSDCLGSERYENVIEKRGWTPPPHIKFKYEESSAYE